MLRVSRDASASANSFFILAPLHTNIDVYKRQVVEGGHQDDQVGLQKGGQDLLHPVPVDTAAPVFAAVVTAQTGGDLHKSGVKAGQLVARLGSAPVKGGRQGGGGPLLVGTAGQKQDLHRQYTSCILSYSRRGGLGKFAISPRRFLAASPPPRARRWCYNGDN